MEEQKDMFKAEAICDVDGKDKTNTPRHIGFFEFYDEVKGFGFLGTNGVLLGTNASRQDVLRQNAHANFA